MKNFKKIASLVLVLVIVFLNRTTPSVGANILGESFGTGITSSTVSGWTEGSDGAESRASNGTGNDSASPDGDRFAVMLGDSGYICKTINTTGYNNVQLSYYWRGDSDSGSSGDNAIVEFKASGNCSDSSGWTQLKDHDMRVDEAWTTQSAFTNAGFNNTSFLLKFRTSTNDNDEHFRVDGINVEGTLIPDVCPNIQGLQETVPEGKYIDQQGNCIVIPATISATKIVCDSEADLPNWGDGSPSTNITSTTAANFIAAHPNNCHLQSGWTFEWANDGVTKPDNNVLSAGAGWTSFGVTDGSGLVTTTVAPGTSVWVREQVNADYIPFSGDTSSSGGWSDTSAEMYCGTDVLNYDNYDKISSPNGGSTYHCVAFNVAKPDVCPNIPELQTTVPEGYHLNDQNECIPDTGTVIASKVVCNSEDDLPNWGDDGEGTPAFITATTASDYVAAHPNDCRLVEDWDFQWVPSNPEPTSDDNAETMGSPWTTFAAGVPTSLPVNQLIWFREQMKPGYVQFSGDTDGSNGWSDESAEFYCHGDVLNYDNFDFVNWVEAGQTYYCVGFNVLKEEPLTCNPDVNLIQNGGFEAPALSPSSWSIIPDTDSLLKWLVAWVAPQINGTLGLEIQNNVAGLPAEGSQHAELDGDHPVSIWQDIPTIPGKVYHLNFKYSARPGRDAADNKIEVKAAGVTLGATLSDDGTSLSNTSWGSQSRSFIATGATTKVEFVDTGTDTSFGGYLDAVSLTCDPNPKATVNATKIVCDSESDLPNWGSGGADITATTASDYVASHPSCHLEPWTFEWAPNGTGNPGDNNAVAGGAWTPFTNSVQVPTGDLVWVREQTQSGYVPFSGATSDLDSDTAKNSAELYCNTDVLNYDNYDWINPVEPLQTYYCVGFNAVAPVDMCPNIAGNQATVPQGMHKDEQGNCVADQNQCDANLDLIVNGSLENGAADIGTFVTLNAVENTSIENWSVDSGSVDYIGSYWLSSDGSRNVDLNGLTAGSISQTIPTVVGNTYTVTFDLSGNPDSAEGENFSPSEKVVRVSATGATDSDYTYDTSAKGNTKEDMKWEAKSYTFTATSTSTTITFASQIAGAFGPAVDNIKIKCTSAPEPTTGSIEIKKYLCPADFVPNRTDNGVGSSVPEGCSPQSGVAFGYVYNPDQNDPNAPYPELEMSLTPGGSTAEGILTIPGLSATGRYLVKETDGTNLLGLYCEGDGDTNPNNNDNQELTFVPAGGVAHCVAYNKASVVIEENPQCSDESDNDEDGLNNAADPGCHSDGDVNNPGSYVPSDDNESNESAQCSDGKDNDQDQLIDSNDPGCLSGEGGTWNPNDDDESNGGGSPTDVCSNVDGMQESLPSNFHFAGEGICIPNGSSSNDTPPAPSIASSPEPGQVLGASTTCVPYLEDYLKRGANNRKEQVMKLQTFLNDYLKLNPPLPVNGVFGLQTYKAVIKFQEQEADLVLKPWIGITLKDAKKGTGWVFKTTKTRINNIMCPELNLQNPPLTLN